MPYYYYDSFVIYYSSYCIITAKFQTMRRHTNREFLFPLYCFFEHASRNTMTPTTCGQRLEDPSRSSSPAALVSLQPCPLPSGGIPPPASSRGVGRRRHDAASRLTRKPTPRYHAALLPSGLRCTKQGRHHASGCVLVAGPATIEYACLYFSMKPVSKTSSPGLNRSRHIV